MTVAAETEAQTQALHHGLRLAQRYQLAERLARGALATVYRGQDLVLRRPIAVKAVPSEQAAAYQESLRTSARLAHPAAICVYDALEQDDWLFIVQEYVNGRPISAYFGQGVPAERAVDLARQIASALAYAHTHGMLHGDLTPTAVLVDRHATVRLNNFGLPPDAGYFARASLAVAASLAADDPTIELSATSEPGMAGAPEQRGLVSAANDTRAVGYLLWRLLTEPVLDAAGVEGDEGVRRFRAEVPRPLRELVVATMIDVAPHPIADAQTLALALERLEQELATGRASLVASPPAAVLAARSAAGPSWAAEDTVQGQRALARPNGVRAGAESAPPLPSGLINAAAAHAGSAPPYATDEGRAAPAPIWGAEGPDDPDLLRRPRRRDNDYDASRESSYFGLPLVAVLLLGAVLFILFFLVGFFSPWSLLH